MHSTHPRLRTALHAATIAALLGLSACSSSSNSTDASMEPIATTPSAPTIPVQSTEPTATTADPAAIAAGVLAPGQTATGSAVLPFVNFDKQEAVFSHRVVSVDPVAAGDRAMILEKSPELADYAMYTLRLESSYVSGADLAFSSFSNGFSVVDASRGETQSVMLIGYDFCKSDSIPSPGNDPSAVIKTCVLSVVPAGGAAPAGISWNQMDTQYDKYDGQPAYILKG